MFRKGMTRSMIVMLAGLAVAPAALAADSGSDQGYPLMGVVRDFRPGHPDFSNGVGDALASSAGNVAARLGDSGMPVYSGMGKIVTTGAKDAQANPIAPGLVAAVPVTNFTIREGQVSSTQRMAAKVTVVGAAITSGNYNAGVTMQVKAGSQTMTPFGSFEGAVSGNVNDNRNPRSYILPSSIDPGTSISIDARSYLHRSGARSFGTDAEWSTYMTVNSSSGGQQVRALRNGDSVPNVGGFDGQTSAKDMLRPYLDAAGKKIKLESNQVIYLFELGSTSTGSSSFDMQDLVVLVELATDATYFERTREVVVSGCVTLNDTAAALGAANTGGVASSASFGTWFADVSGESASRSQSIMMTRDASGVYTYSAPDFTPADNLLYGNMGGAHNRGFTYAIDATTTYSQCAGQFLEVSAGADAWVYVNGSLVIDMGGTHTGGRQIIMLDRLGLDNGAPVRLQMFYAQRSSGASAFGLKTNMVLSSMNSVSAPTVSALHD